ncbi:uncharacterized protein LOC129591452 [Paramacrobiotus metropolitanus]|uniref:uncharacterized protein LOC129591452 n=1 Tax=Paramacrobiotus metropolitanus TaxID=2943436 RepID=UPI002445C886|nr:uncharacterized protein LOC129591452 [Paramacrobiotus metropolitanus]
MGSRDVVPENVRRSFAGGDVVMACDPFVWALEPSCYKTYCAFCFRNKEPLRTCTGCRLHRYCSVTCQTADWKLEHRLECSLLAKIEAGTKMESSSHSSGIGTVYSFQPPQELLTKMVHKIALNVRVDVPGQGLRTAREVLDSLPQHPLVQDKNVIQQTMELREMDPSTGVTMLDILACHGIVAKNTQTIFNSPIVSGNTPNGFAVYPLTPQHDMTAVCWDVNVVINFRAALRFSEMRQQTFTTRDVRRTDFEKSTGHPCTCRKCTEEYDAEINLLKCVTAGCSNRIPSDRRAMEACTECGAINSERLKEFRRYQQRLADYKAFSPTQPNMPEAMRLVMCEEMDAAGILQPDAHFRLVCGWRLPQKYFEEDRFEDGWKMTQQLVASMRIIYPKYEPFGAMLLGLAALYAADALEKHVQDRIKKLSRPAKKQLQTMCRDAFQVLIEYCQAGLHILTVVYGEQSYEAEIANSWVVGETNRSRKINNMLRVRK